MRFTVCDSLTGRIVGTLAPHEFELTDPLRSPGTGSLSVALPSDPDARLRIEDSTQPRKRWVAVAADDGRFLWGGPIPRRPSRTESAVTIPLVDWRSWFYRTPIRPNADGSRRSYIRTGSNALDQSTIMGDLLTIGLDTVGPPRIVIDMPDLSGTESEITCQMLDRSIGDYLDSLAGGPDWHTYIATDPADSLSLIVHVAIDVPERASRPTPIKIEYRRGDGGNAADYSWPEGQDAPTRVYAIGEGQPPDQLWAVDELPDLTDGLEVCWEEVIGPIEGVVKASTAFDHAFTRLQEGQALAGEAEFTLTDAAVPLGDYTTGDRARIVLADGWEDVDVPAARITQRVLSGGRDKPTQARVTVDLGDPDYPDADSEPGEEVFDGADE